MTPAQTGDSPPSMCAPPTEAAFGSTKVICDAAVDKNKYCACAEKTKRILTAHAQDTDAAQGRLESEHRSSRLPLTGLDCACSGRHLRVQNRLLLDRDLETGLETQVKSSSL